MKEENSADVPNFKAVAAPIRVQALPASDLNNITTACTALSISYKPEKVWLRFSSASAPSSTLTPQAPPIECGGVDRESVNQTVNKSIMGKRSKADL